VSAELGITLPKWADESEAPPVDEAALRASLGRQLEENDEKRIALLIFRFRSWAEAYCRLSLERRERRTLDSH